MRPVRLLTATVRSVGGIVTVFAWPGAGVERRGVPAAAGSDRGGGARNLGRCG
jgi:hypothetical protein